MDVFVGAVKAVLRAWHGSIALHVIRYTAGLLLAVLDVQMVGRADAALNVCFRFLSLVGVQVWLTVPFEDRI